MLEQKRRQFWNRQRIPNKRSFPILDFSSSVFCYSRLNKKMCFFFIQFLYSNRKRHVNRKQGRNSKIANDTFVRNPLTIPKLFFFVLASILLKMGKKQENNKNNNKNKTKPKFEKKSTNKMFYFYF